MLPAVMTAGVPPASEVQVTTLELFFDLVFVFTITQLTSLLVRAKRGVRPIGNTFARPCLKEQIL